MNLETVQIFLETLNIPFDLSSESALTSVECLREINDKLGWSLPKVSKTISKNTTQDLINLLEDLKYIYPNEFYISLDYIQTELHEYNNLEEIPTKLLLDIIQIFIQSISECPNKESIIKIILEELPFAAQKDIQQTLDKSIKTNKIDQDLGSYTRLQNEYKQMQTAWNQCEINKEELNQENLTLKVENQRLNEKLNELMNSQTINNTNKNNLDGVQTQIIERLENELAQSYKHNDSINKKLSEAQKQIQNLNLRLNDQAQLLNAETEKNKEMELIIKRNKGKNVEYEVYKSKYTEMESKLEEYMRKLVDYEDMQHKLLNAEKQKLSLDLEIKSLKDQIKEMSTQEKEKDILLKKLNKSSGKSKHFDQEYKDNSFESITKTITTIDVVELKEQLLRYEKENLLLKSQIKTLSSAPNEGSDNSTTYSNSQTELEKQLEIYSMALLKAQKENKEIKEQSEKEREQISQEFEIRFNEVVDQLKSELQQRKREIKFARLERAEQDALTLTERNILSHAFHEMASNLISLKMERDQSDILENYIKNNCKLS